MHPRADWNWRLLDRKRTDGSCRRRCNLPFAQLAIVGKSGALVSGSCKIATIQFVFQVRQEIAEFAISSSRIPGAYI